MSDTTLRDLVLARLEKDTGPEDDWAALVLAALESPEELDQLLADGNGAAQKVSADKAQPRTPQHPKSPPAPPSSAASPPRASAASAPRPPSTSPPAPA